LHGGRVVAKGPHREEEEERQDRERQRERESNACLVEEDPIVATLPVQQVRQRPSRALAGELRVAEQRPEKAAGGDDEIARLRARLEQHGRFAGEELPGRAEREQHARGRDPVLAQLLLRELGQGLHASLSFGRP
jgi:hypothetical protein